MNLSDKTSILQLAALLHAHGVRHAVLCPGSRSAPIVHTLTECGLFTCHRATDERSAAFLALGLALHGAPAAVVCTSGTALLNMHPAVAEAYYQQVPLVVISADRPAAWIGQLDGQTLPQPGAFGPLVRCAVHLPEAADAESAWHCNRLVNEALLETRHRVCGPVHINVPLSEPLYNFTPAAGLPQERVITRRSAPAPQELAWLLQGYRRPVLLPGQLPPGAAAALPQEMLCMAEHLANGCCRDLCRVDELLATPAAETLPVPDLVIPLGGHVVSKRLKQYLRRHRVEHWHICPEGRVADTFCTLTTVFECTPAEFLRSLQSCGRRAGEFEQAWRAAESSLRPADTAADLSLAATRGLVSMLRAGESLHLANSSAVRYTQRFPVPPGVTVCCNRGTNGIEGSLSTAVGYAAAASAPCYVLIGDLSFFYDMNALWNSMPKDNLRIVLLNNGGGKIFSTLPGMPEQGESRAAITGTHALSAQAWAESCGLSYLRATDSPTLAAALTALLQSQAPTLLEVVE